METYKDKRNSPLIISKEKQGFTTKRRKCSQCCQKMIFQKILARENKISIQSLAIARMVQAVQATTNACIRIDYLHHTPWDATLSRTLLM